MAHLTFNIPNIICPACVMHLEALEDELDGVLFVKASYQKQRMDVEFDESQVSEQAIRAAVEEMGYQIA
jgi:copper chaperone